MLLFRSTHSTSERMSNSQNLLPLQMSKSLPFFLWMKSADRAWTSITCVTSARFKCLSVFIFGRIESVFCSEFEWIMKNIFNLFSALLLLMRNCDVTRAEKMKNQYYSFRLWKRSEFSHDHQKAEKKVDESRPPWICLWSVTLKCHSRETTKLRRKSASECFPSSSSLTGKCSKFRRNEKSQLNTFLHIWRFRLIFMSPGSAWCVPMQKHRETSLERGSLDKVRFFTFLKDFLFMKRNHFWGNCLWKIAGLG